MSPYFGNAVLDMFFLQADVIARIRKPAIECEMFARVKNLLLNEAPDLCGQLRGHFISERPDARDEKCLALWKYHRHRIVECGRHGISPQPPALLKRPPTKSDISRRAGWKIGRAHV